jgi:hypothetical protein
MLHFLLKFFSRNKSVRLLNLFLKTFLDKESLGIVKHLIKLFHNYFPLEILICMQCYAPDGQAEVEKTM